MILCVTPHSPMVAAQKDLRWDEEHEPDSQGKSRNLQADIRKMWRVVPLPEEDFSVSPVSAIHAAERVFNSVNLRGMSREQVAKRLHLHLRSPQYGYNAPFWPVPKGAQVLRFDCGNFGWQYSIIYGRDGKVKEVKSLWIH